MRYEFKESPYIISVHPGKVAEKQERCIRFQFGPDAPENYVKAVVFHAGAQVSIRNSHDNPMPCGARVWMESNGPLEVEL